MHKCTSQQNLQFFSWTDWHPQDKQLGQVMLREGFISQEDLKQGLFKQSE